MPGSGRRIALVGLDDVVVVDTPDALLVTTRARAQDVKLVVDALKAEGRTDLQSSGVAYPRQVGVGQDGPGSR